MHLGQYAIRADLKGRGFGRQLLEHVEKFAKEKGSVEIALDTAEIASDLIAMYARHGYQKVGTVKWDTTNYQSVVMSKILR